MIEHLPTVMWRMIVNPNDGGKLSQRQRGGQQLSCKRGTCSTSCAVAEILAAPAVFNTAVKLSAVVHIHLMDEAEKLCRHQLNFEESFLPAAL